MRRFIYKTMNPSIYQGYGRKAPYFEGWYFKLIDASEQHRYAIIPGIFIADDPAKNHAFIQVLDGINGTATYHEYPHSAFEAHPEKFWVRVGDSTFGAESIKVHIDDAQLRLHAEVQFNGTVPWPVTPLAPGIMGWYAWVPFMECYHGVVSLDHTLHGTMTLNDQAIVLDGGRGYIEKDWGQAFPSGYVWQQSNHFSTPGTSLTASIAIIPFMGRSFSGFIVGLWHHGTRYRFATYTGAVTENLTITDDQVFWTLRDKHHRLEMISERVAGGLLKAPIRTEMHKRVDETINSTVKVRLTTLDGAVILDDMGRCAALEVHGDTQRLMDEA